ncbi:MAG: glycoside hydrolase family 26 protein [Kiritimatiellales bacterium]|nr:glycoside hydrolase family 26 protein [Kiritimatiellales bacterium]
MTLTPIFVMIVAALSLSAFAETEMVDPDATPETKALFENLKRTSDKRVLFGHQHATCYGIGWEGGDTNRSDVKTLTGSHPAVYGWDMGHTGTERMDRLIIEAFERGGINTISWHMENLATGKGAKDVKMGSVAALLPGGKHHGRLRKELDGFAGFVQTLEDRNGTLVPIIFRPWHEHTGNWFWWGSKTCTPEEYNQLWRFTVTYLRDEKKVHNLLYALSPSGNHFESEEEYENNRFPGYAYIDIVGFDNYLKDSEFSGMMARCATVSKLARKHGKVAALTEFGFRNGLTDCPDNQWYTHFLRELKKTPDAGGIAYGLIWRNGDKSHFWVPYPGQRNEKDFMTFYNDPMTVFEKDLPDMYKLRQ